MSSKVALMQTKMMLPPQAESFIPRSQFVQHFENATNYRLISISAPAGFGRTTALVQSIQILKKTHAVAWISLDTRDNQANVFLQYFVASLQSIDQSLDALTQQLIEASSTPELSDSLNNIVNDIVNYGKEIFIVLDDYHFIHSLEVQQFLEVLINLAPGNFHLILTSTVHRRNILIYIRTDKNLGTTTQGYSE